MRMAYVCWTVPHPITSGGTNRSHHLLRELAARHEVHVHVPTLEPREPDARFAELFASFHRYPFDYERWRIDRWNPRLRLLPSGVAAFSQGAGLDAFHAWVRRNAPDLIFVDEAVVAPYAWPHAGVPAIVSRQKVDHAYCRDVSRHAPTARAKLFALAESVRFRWYDRRLWARFPFGVVVSEEERETYLAENPGITLAVVPNGVDVEGVVPRPRPAVERPTILLSGLMSYFANVDAAVWFVTSIAPAVFEALPEARLRIVGHAPTEAVRRLAMGDRVDVVGSVPDMRPYLEEAGVVVAPLRVGHGTRLKILEAFAAGRPVVSTAIGAEGLDAERERHLLIADDPSAFASAVVRLFRDRDGAGEMARRARELVEERYSWKRIGAGLDDFCRGTVERWREGAR